MHRRIRQELNPSGEWIEDAAFHNPFPQLQLARHKPIKRGHSESINNKSEYTGTREEVNAQARITGSLKARNKTPRSGVARRTESEIL